MSEPVLRPATPDDDDAIAACIGEAFPSNPKARVDVLRWQYRDNPFGETVGWVYEDDGRVVAHYSAYPMPYLLDGERTVAGNAVDAAIAPSHQGRRLFSPLARALYDDCSHHGMRIAVCYARNPIAMRGVAKAGVQWMPGLRVLVLPRRPGAGRGEEVADVPDGIDELWARTVARDGIRNGVQRGEAWWRWRYAASPLGPYRYFTAPGAAAVVVRHGRVGYVLELLADDERAARRVLRTAAQDVLALVTVAVDAGPLHRLARGAGMFTVPRRLQPRSAYYGVVDTSGAPLGDRAWHIGWGDMDHV